MKPQFVLLAQGIYYLVTAVWPLVNMKTFEKVSGPKFDHWLVHTVALLLLCSSLVFLYSGFSSIVPVETYILSISNCAVLIIIDVFYSLRGRISKIYLLDAIAELMILFGLIFTLKTYKGL